MATLAVKVDDRVKADADRLYKSMGLTLSTAVNAFLLKSLQEGGLPFALTAGIRGTYVNPLSVHVPKRSEEGAAILPADWDDEEDAVYDSLYE